MLFLNDYNVEGVNAKSTAYYDLAKRLRARKVPVQGFGIQGHLAIQYGFPGQVPRTSPASRSWACRRRSPRSTYA